jgi:hypothetical protein
MGLMRVFGQSVVRQSMVAQLQTRLGRGARGGGGGGNG